VIRRTLLSLVLVLTNMPLAFGQQPQEPAVSPPKFPGTQTQNPPQMQKPPDVDAQDVVKITTNLVQVDAVVTKDSKYVTDLTADEFEIFEDGKPQPITNFSYVSNVKTDAVAAPRVKQPSAKDKTAPPIPPAVAQLHDTRRIIALVIDDLGMSVPSISDARRQARKFINEQVAPNDLVAIMHTSGEVGALQQFTTDRRVLFNAIDRLRWYPCSRAGASTFTPLGVEPTPADAPCGGTRNLGGTLQVLKFIVDGMRELPGRKSLVLMSDFLPIETQEPATGSLNVGDGGISDVRTNYTAQLRKVAEMAIRASVVIYAVDTRGLAYTGITAADSLFNPMSGTFGRAPTSTSTQITNVINSTLSARSMAMISRREGGDLIARQTGGFMIRNSNDFGLSRIAEDQKGYYLLAYKPSDTTFNKKFHHIKLTVKRKGLSVRTRNGFLGVRETEVPQPLSTNGQLAKALMSPFGANEVTVRLTSLYANFETGSMLRSLLYIDSKDLTFLAEPGGAKVATFDMGIILFGENGRMVDQQMRQVTVRLTQDVYENAMESGLVYTLDTPIKQAGAFQYRIALRDQNSSKVGSAGQFIEVPNLEKGKMALSGLVVLKDRPDQPAAGVAASGGREAITTGPAVRQFHQGDKLIYAYSIYNAPLGETTHAPQLNVLARIFRDGKLVFTGPASTIDGAQADAKRVPSVGRLVLGPDFEPGQYVLQVVVTDQLTKEKPQVSAQWIDFEIVK
jgi:VWFA-related protein